MSKTKNVLGFAGVGLLIAAIIGAYVLVSHGKPLNEIEINFPSQHLSSNDLQAFLAGDFTIVRDMRQLPGPVLQAYTERGGSRLVMANRGKRFEATDYLRDSSVPRKRLIFAAFSKDKCIVSYEQGGYARTFNIALFRLNSTKADPVWQGFCWAKDLDTLRKSAADGFCKTFRE
jgi:hypothetical protein